MLNQMNQMFPTQGFGDVFEKLTGSNKGVFDAAVTLNEIAVRAQGQLARQQLEAFETCLDAGSKQLKIAAETRDPKELVSKQTAAAVELGEKVVGMAQASLEIQTQARDEMAAWFENSFKAATESTVNAGEAVAKSTRSVARKSA